MQVSFNLDLNTVIATSFVVYVLYNIYCFVLAKFASFNEKITRLQNKYDRIERNFEGMCMTAERVMTKMDGYLENQKQSYTTNAISGYLSLFQQILKTANDLSNFFQPSSQITHDILSTKIMPDLQKEKCNQEKDYLYGRDFSNWEFQEIEKTKQMQFQPEIKNENKRENSISNSSSSFSSSSSSSSGSGSSKSSDDKIPEQFSFPASHMFQQPKNTTSATTTVITATKNKPEKTNQTIQAKPESSTDQEDREYEIHKQLMQFENP
jgi:hypothetical protein